MDLSKSEIRRACTIATNSESSMFNAKAPRRETEER